VSYITLILFAGTVVALTAVQWAVLPTKNIHPF
jgi:hypothetical protein